MNSIDLLRWIHVLSAATWLGEVIVINVILIPVLAQLEREKRAWFMAAVFPRVFQLASIIVATALLSGAALNLSMSGWDLHTAIARLFSGSRWGYAILIAGSLGLGLGLFHFVAESRLEPRVVAAESSAEQADLEIVLRRLKIIPRVGLGILLVIFLLMMAAAHGL